MRYLFVTLLVIVCRFSLSNAQSQQCYTPDHRLGACINIYQCPSLLNIIKKHHISDADRVYLQKSKCGYFGYVAVCCPNESNTKTVTNGLQISDLPKAPTCGFFISDRLNRYYVTSVEYAWTALIEYTKNNNQKAFLCGGVLISKDYVITAAHCVNGKDLQALGWTLSGVRLGELDLRTIKDCNDGYCADPALDVPVIEHIPHENYISDSKEQQNDIALLRLERSIQFTDTIQPICLSASPNISNHNYEYYSVAGWGKTVNGSNSDVKIASSVDNIPIGQCNEFYRNQNIQLSRNQLCARCSKGEHPCSVDSGGALMTLDISNIRETYYFLAGVFSFGPSSCGQENLAGVYTRVDMYIDWILSHMKA